MIYTITLNPSLDYIMHLEDLKEGETNRAIKEQLIVGGKGFNVSTILSRLNKDNKALGFVSGFVGDEVVKQLKDRHIECDLCYLNEGVTRINVKLKGVKETEINGNGPYISKEALNELFNKLACIKDGDVLILAGSIPKGVPQDIYMQILQFLNDKDIMVVVDATKDLLLKVLPYHPFLIKPNLRELEELFNVAITTKEQLIAYAFKLKELGAINVLISLGKDGSLLIDEYNKIYYSPALKGKLINSVGSGDSMVGGFVCGYLNHSDYKEALRLANACGGANAFSEDLADAMLIKEMFTYSTIKEWE